MKPFHQFIAESHDASHARAKSNHKRLLGLAGTVGAHAGSARVIQKHKGGQLQRTTVYDHNTGYTNKRGHHYSEHYSARPGHDAYTHVHFKGHVPDNVDEITDHIKKQNPHHADTGHPRSLAMTIHKHQNNG